MAPALTTKSQVLVLLFVQFFVANDLAVSRTFFLLPQIANQAGWFTAEMGRQPWVVYGLLRTSDALSRAVTANQIVFSLILFTIVYIVLFALFLFLLNRKIQHGPVDYGTKEEIESGQRRDNPLLEAQKR